MRIRVLYREPADIDKRYPLDSQGRGDLKHIRRINRVLRGLGHQSELVDINVDSYEYLRHSVFDLAFNLCDDGFRNEALLEAHVPAMLDILQIPYTGSGLFTLATCLNKARTKKILLFHSIPTPEFQVFRNSREKLSAALIFPLIVKPVHEDASIGLRKESVVNNLSELRKRIELVINNYRQPALVERFIQGREVYAGILGNGKAVTVLPLSEITFDRRLPQKAKICTYEAKWGLTTKQYRGTQTRCPAKLDQALKRKLMRIAKQAYCLLECQDYGRIDFRIDENNQPYVLEVNPNPDISEDAGLAKMARVAGLNYSQLIEKILTLALTRNGKRRTS